MNIAQSTTICSSAQPRARVVVARGANAQPRTYRLVPPRSREAAYRRLAAAILGLDVQSLVVQLRAARRALVRVGASTQQRQANAA